MKLELAEKDRQRNRPVINQFCEFIGQALLQHNAYVSVASDLAGSCTPNAGSLKFDLSKTDGLDIVGACIAQVEKIKKQQEIPKLTPASATHQASTSSSTAEPIQEAQPATPLTTPQQASLTENAPVDSIETVLMRAPATPLSENEAFDFVQTALNQHGQTIDNEHARKLLTMWAPAVTKGTAIGFLKLVNPANLLLVPYYKVQLASELTGFVFKEVVYFASYLQLRSTDPIAAQQVLDKCTEPFKKLGTTWDALDEPARVEMISQLATEIIAGNKATQIRDQFMKSAIEKTAKFAAASKVLKGFGGTEHTPSTSQTGAQKLVGDDAAKTTREVILPKVKTFEQARNKAFEMLDGILGPDSKPFIGSLEKSAGFGKVIGRVSADNKVRWRLDYDSIKGLHINIENFREGKGCKAQKFAIPFEGNEETYKALLKHLNS